MQLTVKCFATLAPLSPKDGTYAWACETGTVADLMVELNVPAHEVKLIFVNGVSAEPNRTLVDGDRVGLFPAVGGG